MLLQWNRFNLTNAPDLFNKGLLRKLKPKKSVRWSFVCMWDELRAVQSWSKPVSVAGKLKETAHEFFLFPFCCLRAFLGISVSIGSFFSYHFVPRICFLSLKVRNLPDVWCFCCENENDVYMGLFQTMFWFLSVSWYGNGNSYRNFVLMTCSA